MSCTFCDLIQGAAEVSVCYEDAEAIAFMDIQPVNAGHVLVVPRTHYDSLLDVPQELGAHLFSVTMRLANAVRGVTGCEGMNLVVNSGVAAGQDVFHYHVHIIPRTKGDGFEIELPFAGSSMPDRTVLDMTAARILAAMQDPMRQAGGGGQAGRGRTPESAEAQHAATADGAAMTDPAASPITGGRRTIPRGMRLPVEAIAAADRSATATMGTGIPVHREPSAGRTTLARQARGFAVVEGPHGELVHEVDGAA